VRHSQNPEEAGEMNLFGNEKELSDSSKLLKAEWSKLLNNAKSKIVRGADDKDQHFMDKNSRNRDRKEHKYAGN
jgi:hypothetical protein